MALNAWLALHNPEVRWRAGPYSPRDTYSCERYANEVVIDKVWEVYTHFHDIRLSRFQYASESSNLLVRDKIDAVLKVISVEYVYLHTPRNSQHGRLPDYPIVVMPVTVPLHVSHMVWKQWAGI